MKIVTKWCVALILIGMFSCEQEQAVTPVNQVQELTNKIISSDNFRNLDIPNGSLIIDNSQFINAEQKSIFIPFKGYDDRKGVVALFDDKYKVISVTSYEAITDLSSDLILSELKSGDFSGSFVFTAEDGELNIQMQRSKITSYKTIESHIPGRMSSCAGMTENGGALWCAGTRLENMNFFDATLCYVSFMPCMVEMVISCAIDGCNP